MRKGRSFRNPGFAQDDSHPVVCVNWDDAKAYAKWLSGKTGKDYRLLSEAEWEYACRAGTSTPFWWGSSISTEQANYDGNYTFGGGRKGEYRQRTVPVKSFEPNPWGLYQVHGNVGEWCEDCWNESYNGAPSDGSAWTAGDCAFRLLRGGSWDHRSVVASGRPIAPGTSRAIEYNTCGFPPRQDAHPLTLHILTFARIADQYQSERSAQNRNRLRRNPEAKPHHPGTPPSYPDRKRRFDL